MPGTQIRSLRSRPEGARARLHRGDGAVDTGDDAPCMREERLPVERQPDPSGGAGEEAYLQLAFQGGDPLRNRLLCHAELVGRVSQLSEVGRPDERPHRFTVH
jgi:hypothetical protein